MSQLTGENTSDIQTSDNLNFSFGDIFKFKWYELSILEHTYLFFIKKDLSTVAITTVVITISYCTIVYIEILMYLLPISSTDTNFWLNEKMSSLSDCPSIYTTLCTIVKGQCSLFIVGQVSIYIWRVRVFSWLEHANYGLLYDRCNQ